MSFRKHTAQQQAHINTFRFITGFLCMVIVVLAYCVWEARKDLWIHIPPDLRSGSTRLWWDIPPESVYAFGLYIFQQVQRWPKDGEVDYKGNLFRYAAYLTPSCKVFLEKDFEFRRNAGELRGRERTTSEIPGRGIGESNGRVIQHSINDWTVNLDMDSTEYYAGEIKRALARYPLHVIRADVDPETNPFGLQWDCYSDTPQRIELEEPAAPPSGREVYDPEVDRLALANACPTHTGPRGGDSALGAHSVGHSIDGRPGTHCLCRQKRASWRSSGSAGQAARPEYRRRTLPARQRADSSSAPAPAGRDQWRADAHRYRRLRGSGRSTAARAGQDRRRRARGSALWPAPEAQPSAAAKQTEQAEAPKAVPRETPVPVVLTRYAAQMLYAPLRTVEPVDGVGQVRVKRQLDLTTLLPSLPITATALGAWRLDDYYVTAVKLQNASAQHLALDPRDLMGNFVAATFQHPHLGPGATLPTLLPCIW